MGINERKLHKSELKKRDQIVWGMLKNKRSLVRKHGADAEKLMYSRGAKMAMKETDNIMDNHNLKDLIQQALLPPKSNKGNDIPKDKDKGDDLDLGHVDNEPHALKADLYRIGKYAMELYKMVGEFEGKGEVDFPSWWQSKIFGAKEALVSAKHYLDFETKEDEIDAMVDVASDEKILDKTMSVAETIAKQLKS